MLPVPAFHGAVHFARRVPLGDGGTFVIELFALAQADFDFDAGIFEIHAQRDDRIAVLLGFAEQGEDFLFMQQQPPDAHGIFIENVPLLVWADMHAADENFAVLEGAVSVLQVDRAGADGFHLGAGKLDACFQLVLDKVNSLTSFNFSNSSISLS